MVRHVRVRLSTDSVTDSRTGTDLGVRGVIDGEACPREGSSNSEKQNNPAVCRGQVFFDDCVRR